MSHDLPARGANARTTDTPSPRRPLNRSLLLTVLAMLAFAGALVASYFMPWSYVSLSLGGPPFPGSTPIVPGDGLLTAPTDFTIIVGIVLLGPPSLYALFGLLGLWIPGRWRIALGMLALLAGVGCVVVTFFVSQVTMFTETGSANLDFGAGIGATASLLMFFPAGLLINQRARLFLPAPLK